MASVAQELTVLTVPNQNMIGQSNDVLQIRLVDCDQISCETFSLNNTRNIYSGTTQTSAGPSVVLTTIMANNTSALYELQLSCSDSNGNTGVWKAFFKVKNFAGNTTMGSVFDQWDDVDSAISTANYNIEIAGNTCTVNVQSPGTVLNWACCLLEILVQMP